MSQRRDPTDQIEELRAIPDDGDVLEPLLNIRRRTIVRYMARLPPDAVVGTAELGRVVAAVELDIPLHEVSNHDYRRIYQALRQRDVTKLSIAEILDKHDKQTIVRGERFEYYAGILDAIDEFIA